MADLVMKQARAIVDDRTTVICLDIHGIVMPVDQPFETLAGDFMQPPFHVHCRTLVGPHMPGFIAEARRAANKELKTRPKSERRRGPDGPAGQIPGPVTKNPPSGFSRRDEEAAFKDGAKAEPFTPEKELTGPARLKQQFERGYTGSADHIWQGNRAEVEIGRLADGTKVVRKMVTSEQEADKEYLAGLIANALGIKLDTSKVGPQELVTEYVEGQTGNGWLNEHGREFKPDYSIKSDRARGDALQKAKDEAMVTMAGGKEIGLLDFLIENPDRHPGNWMIRDGQVYPIDHGNSHFAATKYEDEKTGKELELFCGSPFSEYWLGASLTKFSEIRSLKPAKHWTREELQAHRDRLAGLSPEFAAYPQWLEYVLSQMDRLIGMVK
jgi:hypothetical protein